MFRAERISGSAFELDQLTEFLRPPFRKFELPTPMSPAHAARILQENVEPPRRWGRRSSSKRGYFEGKVAGTRFKIHRIIGYQGAFLPIIEGNFQRNGQGSIMTLNMRLVWPVVPFWLGIILFLLWSSVAVDSRVAGPFTIRLAMIAMALITYLVAAVPFAIETRIAMKRLMELMPAGSTGSDLPLPD